MPLELVDTIVGIYSARPLHTLIHLANLIISLMIAKTLVGYAVEMRGRSLSYSLRYLAYAFVVLALISISQLLSPLPWFDWELTEAIAYLVFLLMSLYAVGHIAQTVEAYSSIHQK
ncbi:MAG: hypothetical protein QXU54_03370 [Candidatus Micrarchaeia archaeon]